MNNSITICDFGTAPEQKLLGYKLSGFELTCHEDDLPSLLRLAGDVRVVRGGAMDNGEQCFYVMVKCHDEPIAKESIQTVDDMISQVKQEVANLEPPVFKINVSNFSCGERAIILATLTKEGYFARCNETTLSCRVHPKL